MAMPPPDTEREKWGKEKANFERSYNSMWRHINNARSETQAIRENYYVLLDLAVALQHDIGNGLRVNEEVHNILFQCKEKGLI